MGRSYQKLTKTTITVKRGNSNGKKKRVARTRKKNRVRKT